MKKTTFTKALLVYAGLVGASAFSQNSPLGQYTQPGFGGPQPPGSGGAFHSMGDPMSGVGAAAPHMGERYLSQGVGHNPCFDRNYVGQNSGNIMSNGVPAPVQGFNPQHSF